MAEPRCTIRGVNGPVVTAQGARGLAMTDMVRVGHLGLMGEVVGMEGDRATIQVYEETGGLAPGQPVVATGGPLSITLGPGLVSGMFDGIARPLRRMEEEIGPFLSRGLQTPTLDPERRWQVKLLVEEGQSLSPGVPYAQCPETSLILHRCLTPAGLSGTVVKAVPEGSYTVDDPLVEVADSAGHIHTLRLAQRWPVRRPRPVGLRLPIQRPLLTGQRIIDAFFPLGKGGAAALPGPFGAGKTMTQHQLAKWSDADLILYLGCGERGNEMTQALEEFSALRDPRSGRPLMERTILIANTSNMPVAAREASVYTGMTMAEYYRDMGYHVALMADSTSRWAEALRELSGRLEEMPAEEGFPAYLASRLAGFYERAGYVRTLEGREGSVTAIGAVSPQGGDFSEPVTQNTRRFVRCFWALDRSLAYARHFPAIHWMGSYSEYATQLGPWYEENVGPSFSACRSRLMGLLQEEDKLMEIVKLIGADLLPEDQRLTLATCRLIRVGFLQQNAYHPVDTYVSLKKQLRMMQLILQLHDGARRLLAQAIPLSQITGTGIFDALVKMKYQVPNEDLAQFDSYAAQIEQALSQVERENA